MKIVIGKDQRLNNGCFGFSVKKMHLAHIKDKIHVMIDLGPIMSTNACDEIMSAGI